MAVNWLFGYWTIFDEDREAQKRGEPYWTFVEKGPHLDEGLTFAEGPYGRKSMDPDAIVEGIGYECDGLNVSPENAAYIQKAVKFHSEFVEAAKFCCTIMGFGVSGIIRLRAILKALGEEP